MDMQMEADSSPQKIQGAPTNHSHHICVQI